MKTLVVGARRGSLGMAIAQRLSFEGVEVVTAGISGVEHHPLDLIRAPRAELRGYLAGYAFTHIVVTAGINEILPPTEEDEYAEQNWYLRHYAVNVIGPMRLLTEFVGWSEQYNVIGALNHYIVISSNSAHIARTNSAAYCSSKAALSMALRVKARELAGTSTVAYGYEPGLLHETPMTVEVSRALSVGLGLNTQQVPLSRMRGLERGLDSNQLARMVVSNLLHGGRELNGCLFRVDAGEQ